MELKRILFLHNTLMPYRKPFFENISKIYDIYFVFTNIDLSCTMYGVYYSPMDFADINYRILPKNFKLIRLIWEICSNKYDIVVESLESLAPLTYIIAVLRQKKIILWSEEWDSGKLTFRRRFSLPIVRFLAYHSNALLVPGTKHREYFINMGVPSSRIFIMPNASDISNECNHSKSDNAIEKKYNLKDKKIVLFVGRLVEQKGVKYLIEAFARLKTQIDNVVLIIVGSGECKIELELLCHDLGIQNDVVFAGHIVHESLSDFYQISNICVVPSISQTMKDAWVFVVNEAMHFGKPVIATDAVGAAFDMIKDGINGFIVPEKDSKSLFIAMKDILCDENLEAKMQKESKRIIDEDFSYENMFQGFSMAIDCLTLTPRR